MFCDRCMKDFNPKTMYWLRWPKFNKRSGFKALCAECYETIMNEIITESLNYKTKNETQVISE